MHKTPFLLNLEPCLPCSWYLRFHVSRIRLFHTIVRTLCHFSLTLLSLPSLPRNSVSLYHTSARLSFLKCTYPVPSSPFFNILWLLHICDMEPRFPDSTPRACHDLCLPASSQSSSTIGHSKWFLVSRVACSYKPSVPLHMLFASVIALPSLPGRYSFFRLSLTSPSIWHHHWRLSNKVNYLHLLGLNFHCLRLLKLFVFTCPSIA